MNSKALFLEIVETYVKLDSEEFDAFYESFELVEIPKKQKVVLIQKENSFEYIVVKGCLKSFVFDEKGREKILDFYLEGNWLMDGSACSLGELDTMEVETIENCMLLRMNTLKKEELLTKYPKIESFYQKKYYKDIVQSHARILSLLRNSTGDKYRQLITQHPSLLQRIPKSMIAYYLGVSRETLSRLENSVLL